MRCRPAVAMSQRKTQGYLARSVRILKDRPTIYISFERTGKREPLRNGESAEGIWLRLHNNSRWAIRLHASEVPSKVYGDAGLFYEVLADEKVTVDMNCHVCSANMLAPGKSILFSLPREYLDEGLSVRINFNYEWELDKNVSYALEPQHFVYFHSSRLPSTVSIQKSKQ